LHFLIELVDLFTKAGFEIVNEKMVISEKKSYEKAARYKVPVMYAAFIQKRR
jgi:hypothetical protein